MRAAASVGGATISVAGLGEPPSRPYRVLSLGAGVQSTALALMSGVELDSFDFGVFADTGLEPAAVYSHLDWLRSSIDFPIVVVRAAPDLREKVMSGVAVLPAFVGRRGDDRPGMLTRQCTRTFKVEPIMAAVRRVIAPGRSQLHVRDGRPWVEQSLGITTDEASRMRPASVKWVKNVYPLVHMGMSRSHCVEWLSARGVDAPRSACVCCPYRSAGEWRAVAADEGDWSLAVRVDEAVRASSSDGVSRWLLRQCVPLAEADLSDKQRDLWGAECTGMCRT